MKQILLFLFYLGLVRSYILKCPGTGQWRLRSTHFCERAESYVCLYNVIDKVYVENCNGPRRETIGDKTVININGRFDNVYCSNGRFQPAIFSTSEGSECVFKKSTCSEEGQLISINGSSFEDITCKCDYTRGYQYLSSQRHDHCSCKPLNEDCSCQIHICGEGETLSRDYTCVNNSESHTDLECSQLYINQTSEEKGRELKLLTTEKNDKEASFLMFFVLVVILLTSVTGVGLLRFDKGIYRLLDEDCYKEYFKTDLEDITVTAGNTVILSCEVRSTGVTPVWYKSESKLVDKRYEQSHDRQKHTLKIADAKLDDNGVFYVDFDGHASKKIKVTVEGKIIIPLAIQNLSEREKEEYYKILEDGYEKRYYVKIFLVGKEGTGKTSLMRRLLLEELSKEREPTDGIDIIVKRCKIAVDDGTWLFHTGSDKREITERLGRAVGNKYIPVGAPNIFDREPTKKNPSQRNLSENTSIQNSPKLQENSEKQQIQLEIKQASAITSTNTTDGDYNSEDDSSSYNNGVDDSITYEKKPLHSNIPFETPEEIDFRQKQLESNPNSKKDLRQSTNEAGNGNNQSIVVPRKQTADCIFLDFAGQKEYYVTHQTFLTYYAIYLVVASLEDMEILFSCDGPDEEKLCFWFDSIHCYASQTSGDLEKLDPPILVVCTKCDDDIQDLESLKSKFKEKLDKMLTDSKDRRKHLREGVVNFLSNTSKEDTEFGTLREKIYKTAKGMPNWGEDLPVRWIKLEQKLDDVKSTKTYPVMTTDEVINLAKHEVDLPQTTIEKIKNETLFFLKYQHLTGNVIFFEDLKDFVILKPKWLIDVFRKLVCADCFQTDKPHKYSWNDIKKTWLVKEADICDLLSEIPENDHHNILSMMEKFDIIVRDDGENNYVIPSMIKTEYSLSKDIYENLVNRYTKSSWLCLVFEFLPPALFNHVTVKFMRDANYTRHKLWHNALMLDLQNERHKLIICKWSNALSVQYLVYGENDTFASESILRNIKQSLLNIQEVIRNTTGENRYRIQVHYKANLMCSEHFASVVQSRDINELKFEPRFACEHKDGVQEHDSFEPMFSIWIKHLYYLLETKQLAVRRLEEIIKKIEEKLELSDMLPNEKAKFQQTVLSYAKETLNRTERVSENEINTMSDGLRHDLEIIGKRPNYRSTRQYKTLHVST